MVFSGKILPTAACIVGLFAPVVLMAQEEISGTPLYSGQQVELLRGVEEARNRFLEAYDASDVGGLVGAFAENATFAGTLQPFWLDGLGEIEDLWSRYVAVWPEATLKFRQPTVRFYNDTMSVETGYMEMYMRSGQEGGKQVVTDIRYSITRVLTEKGWLIVNMNVNRMPPPR
jgi:hypothetical protein